MKRNRFIRSMALLLALLTFVGAFGISAAAESVPASSVGSGMTAEEMRELLSSDSYAEYIAEHPNVRGDEEVVIDGTAVYSYSDGSVTYYYDAAKECFYKYDEFGVRVDIAGDDIAITMGEYGGVNALYAPASGTVAWKVNVPSTGRYAIEVEYYQIGNNATSIERMLYIDGKIPFSEARYFTFSKYWRYEYEKDENGNPTFKTDKNGNQLKPNATPAPQWSAASLTDSNGFYQGNFEFYLTEGEHTLAFAATREAMAIKSIRLYPYEGMASYKDVLASYPAGAQPAGSATTIKLEAEMPYLVSDTSVYAANDRTSAVTSPSSPSAQLMNVLGANSYDTIGQWAAYQFTVPKTGLYTISIRCMQTELAGMYTSRALRLAGGVYGDTLAIPFAEAYNVRFNYDKAWQIVTLGDGTDTFQFYFEEGVTYTMSLDVSLGTLSKVIEDVQNSLSIINDCYLEILKLTGPEPDEYRDYNFGRVMPKTLRNINRQYLKLTEVSEALTALSGSKGAHVATLDKVSLLLKTMTNEDKIAENLSNLKSYIGTLGTWLNTSKQQSLKMDYIVINGSATTEVDKQYKANAGFFESAGYEIVAFFQSFFVDYNNMGVTDAEGATSRVEAWLATGRDQASIWRNLIDSNFTSTDAGRGVAVDLKLVAAGTLLPSVLAGQGPDVYIGLSSGDTINYAIRSAVLSVSEFVNRPEEAHVLDGYNQATLVPLAMYDELYGLPEQITFSMLFYRKDALANLGLDVPQTWDDLLTCVPVLQASNMQIGMARDYNMFLYQRGGDRWKYAGSEYSSEGKYAELMSDSSFSIYFDYMEIGYDTNVALDAFKFMCRFYTDYSFPVAYDAANRFRTGEMPLVIADAVSMYNQLTVFATEIRGLWMFTNVPGTRQSDGSISNLSIAGVNAVVMMNGVDDAEASWKFMKWQVSSDVQAEYGNGQVALIGPAAKYSTANMEALKKMSWTTEEYNNLISQFNSLASIPNYPGAYIIDRYLNFAFLNAYEDGLDPVEQLKGYVKDINKEINRKREEFELPVLDMSMSGGSATDTAANDQARLDKAIEEYIEYLKTLDESELSQFSDTVKNYIKGA